MSVAMQFSVPLVDFAGFQGTGSSRDREIGQSLYNACRTSGFAILTGTRITEQDAKSMLAEAKRFFDQPDEVKDQIRHPPEAMNHVGWSKPGREILLQHVYDKEEISKGRKKAPDYKESLEVWKPDHPFLHNLFLPEEQLPGFRQHALDFFEECATLGRDVLRALACGLPGNLPATFFDDFHTEKTCQLRLLHYPSAPSSLFSEHTYQRMNAHSDYATCTLLLQDEVGGLQVEDPHHPGTFVDVPHVPGGIVFNVADLLQRWSNDQLKSSVHRVVPPAPRPGEDQSRTPDRYSLPFFISADWDKTISVLDVMTDETRPPKYEPITAGAYIEGRMNAAYG